MQKNTQRPIEYAWIFAGLLTILIIAFWVFHLKKNFEVIKVNPKIQSVENLKSDVLENLKPNK